MVQVYTRDAGTTTSPSLPMDSRKGGWWKSAARDATQAASPVACVTPPPSASAAADDVPAASETRWVPNAAMASARAPTDVLRWTVTMPSRLASSLADSLTLCPVDVVGCIESRGQLSALLGHIGAPEMER